MDDDRPAPTRSRLRPVFDQAGQLRRRLTGPGTLGGDLLSVVESHLRPGAEEPPPPQPTRRQRAMRCAKWSMVAVLVVVLLFELSIVSLRWWAFPRTAFMLEDNGPVVYQYVSIDHVSRLMIAATIAHEDQQLGTRHGPFAISDFSDRIGAHLRGEPDPSGSTIPQQLAKNIYLWPHQDALRKGLEALLSVGVSATLSDRRIVELYVNYAQFGPNLYGVCAASWYYFDEPPWNLAQIQADQLMGVLPLPDLVERASGGGLDIGPDADPRAVDLINGEANVHVPAEIAGMGGWQQAVATIGIHDTAADHAAQRSDPDACSTMPDVVAARITRENSAE